MLFHFGPRWMQKKNETFAIIFVFFFHFSEVNWLEEAPEKQFSDGDLKVEAAKFLRQRQEITLLNKQSVAKCSPLQYKTKNQVLWV